MIPEGYAEVRHFFGGAAVPNGGMCTYGIFMDSGSVGGTALADQLADAWVARINPYCVNGVTYFGCEVKYGPEETGPTYIDARIVVGAGGTAQTFPQATYLVRKQTAFGGRSGRGRFYVPGIGENQVDNAGVIDTAHRSGFQTNLNAFFNDHITNDTPMMLFHQPGAPLSSPTPVTSLSLDSRIATQRRRLRG